MLGVVALNFFLLQLVPGDAAERVAAEAGSAAAEIWSSCASVSGSICRCSSGCGPCESYRAVRSGDVPRHNLPVLQLIVGRFGNTLLLMATALAISFAMGVLLGAVMASKVGRWPDRVLSIVALLLYSTPGFWLGLMAIVLFAVRLGWLPPGGHETIGASYTGWAHLVDVASYLVMPALVMSGFYIALFGRLTRAAMLEVSRLDHVRTAVAKGVTPRQVVVRRAAH